MKRLEQSDRRQKIIRWLRNALIILGTGNLTLVWGAAWFFFGLEGSAFLITETLMFWLLAAACLGTWMLVTAINLDKEQ